MDHIGIYVIENGKRYTYKRIYGENNIPNYYPPESKSEMYKDMYVDEIMFFPIEREIFDTDRKNKFFAFRYLFNSSWHNTVALGPDRLKLGVTHMQLTAEVQRVRYFISGNNEVTVDKVMDPLHPPRVFDITSRANEIGKHVEHLISTTVTQWNQWYMDKRV